MMWKAAAARLVVAEGASAERDDLGMGGGWGLGAEGSRRARALKVMTWG